LRRWPIPQAWAGEPLPVRLGINPTVRAFVTFLMMHGWLRPGYDYLVARKLRQAHPEMGLTTDIIVGFPGETDADLDDTLDLLERVEYDSLFSFKYSRRPNTPALALDDHQPP
jgi:tRNA-2-methylthio-N6-dimethylallyladenosine synthase